MPEKEHFLNVFPLEWSRVEVQELHALFSRMYFREDDAIRLVQRSGIPVEDIRWGASMSAAWHEIMEVAHDRGKLRSLIEVILEDPSKTEYQSRINELLLKRPIIATPSGGNIEWRSDVEMDEHRFERIIGERSTLLDIAFLKEGLRVSKAVMRITVTFSDGQYYGTGFLISDDLVLTNHHVLFNHAANDERASMVDLWFDYERAFGGGLGPRYEIQGDTSSIIGDRRFDWAVVRLANSITGLYPYLRLGGKMPSVDDRVYIIQHPAGAAKQIGLHNNIVRYIDDKVVQYWTDTEGGSSGSPVFNSNWEVVALHQGWDLIRQHSLTEYRNQGVHINQVIQGLNAHGIILQPLKA